VSTTSTTTKQTYTLTIMGTGSNIVARGTTTLVVQ
jgi:hypothetical protein